MRFTRSLFVFVLATSASLPAQDYTVVFEGRPIRKVESSLDGTIESTLAPDDAFKYSVRIVERQGKYFWASRNTVQLRIFTRKQTVRVHRRLRGRRG